MSAAAPPSAASTVGAGGGSAGILARQVIHELKSLLRTPITLILSVGFPLLFFVLVGALIGNEVIDERGGIRLAQFMAPSFASFGIVMATFSFLAYGLAEARSSGVVKRQTGTPLPAWALLGGRIGAALLLGLIASVLVIGVGVVFYDVQIIWRTMPAVLVTIVLASMSFSALGLGVAVLSPSPQFTLALTNGLVIPIAFVSEVLSFGGEMPPWMSGIGWFFPLRHLVNALGDAFNPYLDGSGFDGVHLGVILAWGLAGAVVAAWALRRERDRSVSRTPRSAKARPSDATPRRVARPSTRALVRDQIAHTASILWRDASATFFAVIFPVLLVVIIPTINGGGDLVLPNGYSLAAFFAVTMSIYGMAVTTYVNTSQGVAEQRDRGILKRSHGSPLPGSALLVGRVVGAIVVSLITWALIQTVAAAMYGTPFPPGWGTALVVFLTSAVCFSLVGLAVASVAKSAEAGIGIALGTLLPLCFISDVFVVGADFPPVINTISWIFPLRHATAGMTATTLPNAAVLDLPWDHLAVIAAWAVLGAVVVRLRFTWASVEGRGGRAKGGRKGGGTTASTAAARV
jgi:ABC-2 type transport system permease protein